MARIWAVAELALACAAVLGCAISWSAVRSSVVVAPVVKGQPTTTSVVYDPPLLLLTLLLAAAAGMLAVAGAARLRRVSRHHPGRQPNRSSG
jgi:NO-binding membrane sensor protein with MHYT domain